MSDSAQLRPVYPTPTGAIRSVQQQLDTLERGVAEVRAALSAAESELLAAWERVTPEPLALTTTQVAELLGLSRSTVTAMIGRRELASVKVGGSRRVLRRDLDAYLESVAAGGAA